MEIPAVAAAWIAAVALTGTGAPWWGGAIVAAGTLPLAFALAGKRGAVVAMVAVAAALVAGYRFDAWLERPPPALIAAVGADAVLEGTIASEPDPGLTVTRYEVDVRRVAIEGGEPTATEGRVIVALHQYDEYLPGDRVRVAGELEAPEPFDGFDYPAYLLRRGVVATMYRPRVELVEPGSGFGRELTAFRLRLDRALQRALPEPEAALAGGMAAGRDEGLARAVRDDFRDAGLAHLLAVSGSNIVLMTSLTLAAALRFLSRQQAVAIAGTTALAYVLLAGAEPSVVRAAVMAAILLAGDVLGRPRAGLAALGVAVIGMTVHDPGIAADAGFQLSASATAGIIAFAPWILAAVRSVTERGPVAGFVPGLLGEQAAITAAASLATAAVTWAVFGRVQPLAPVANIVAAPLFTLAFLGSLACGLAGLVSDRAGWAVGLAAYYPITLLRRLAGWVAGIPGASIDAGDGDAEIALALGAALTAAGFLAYRRYAPSVPSAAVGWSVRAAQAVALAGVVVPAVYVLSIAPIGGPGELVVTFLDVGQGDAILITTPDGQTTLIDGGPSGAALAYQLGSVLPHWQRTIDEVILTHPQEDHVAGLPGLLDRFRTGVVAGFGSAHTTRSNAELAERAPPLRRLAAGDAWERDGVRFEVLWPPAGYSTKDVNDESVILLVTYGLVRILLTGDAEARPLDAVAALTGPVTVLKVPHHGSKTTPARFFAATAPQIAVISVGPTNPYGHPAPETLDALAATPLVLQTGRDGRIQVRSDGQRLGVRIPPGAAFAPPRPAR